jgi:hypothetical protein
LDADEGLTLFVSVIISIVFIVRWYGSLLTVTALPGGRAVRVLVAVLPIGCLAGLQFFLVNYAAHEVREDAQYDVLFLAGGGAWIALSTESAKLAGLSARDDVIEARNPAALVALCGWWIGMMICYSAANIGEGPTIWTTFIPAGAASAAMLMMWLVLAAFTGLSEAIAVDRDVASGVRLAGFFVGSGVILGSAVAGDWESWEGTWHDFLVQCWPVGVLLAAALVPQIIWRPTPARPNQPVGLKGVIPATAFVACAAAWVAFSRLILGMGGH